MYVALPCYIVYYMPSTISLETLGANWFFPLVGFVLITFADLFGLAAAKLWARPGDLATYRQLVGLPNWVFMALAVCEPMFGEDGIRVVLLYNIAIMFHIWSFGMTSYKPGVGVKDTLKNIFLNVQTIANFLGFGLALAFPVLKGMEKLTSPQLAALPVWVGIWSPFWETIYLLGATALPLSIFQIGLLLGNKGEAVAPLKDNRSLVATSFLRLLVEPVLLMALLLLMCHFGVPMTRNEFIISVIIMSMPAAVLCITVAEVYGGNALLAARTVLWMTLASLLTAPIMTWVAEWAYGLR